MTSHQVQDPDTRPHAWDLGPRHGPHMHGAQDGPMAGWLRPSSKHRHLPPLPAGGCFQLQLLLPQPSKGGDLGGLESGVPRLQCGRVLGLFAGIESEAQARARVQGAGRSLQHTLSSLFR